MAKKKTIEEDVEEKIEEIKKEIVAESTERPEIIEQHRLMVAKALADQKLANEK